MTPVEALNSAIFSINTFLHPDASSDEDMRTLDETGEQAIRTLVEIREWHIANPEWEEA